MALPSDYHMYTPLERLDISTIQRIFAENLASRRLNRNRTKFWLLILNFANVQWK